MGAWGTGPFENDTAADWWAGVEPESIRAALESALAGAGAGSQVSAPIADEALAAVAIVALALDPTLPEEWRPPDQRALDAALLEARQHADLAVQCVPVILESESAVLWSGDTGWSSMVLRLREAVGGNAVVLGLPSNESEPNDRERLKQTGLEALADLEEAGLGQHLPSFQRALGTVFYAMLQLSSDAAREVKAKSLAQHIEEFSDDALYLSSGDARAEEASDTVFPSSKEHPFAQQWRLGKKGKLGSVLAQYRKMLGGTEP